MIRRFIAKGCAISCVLAMLLSGCGGNTVRNELGVSSTSKEEGKPIESTAEPVSDKDGSNTGYDFCNEFNFFGHAFPYTNDFQYNNNSAGGISLAKGLEYWITVDSLDYYGLDVTVDGFDGIVEACQTGVTKMLEDRYSSFFMTGKTIQHVSGSEIVKGKNVDVLKVKGIFEDTFDGDKYDYIIFYFIVQVGEKKYPFYMTGMVYQGKLEDMEAYMDASLDYIKPIE